MSLYREFNRVAASRVLKIRHGRAMPPIVVDLGNLLGLIYRSDKGDRR
jgi:hypothetical protein